MRVLTLKPSLLEEGSAPLPKMLRKNAARFPYAVPSCLFGPAYVRLCNSKQ